MFFVAVLRLFVVVLCPFVVILSFSLGVLRLFFVREEKGQKGFSRTEGETKVTTLISCVIFKRKDSSDLPTASGSRRWF